MSTMRVVAVGVVIFSALNGCANTGNVGNTGRGFVPYGVLSVGYSSARNANFQDDASGPGSDCFLITTGTTCTGTLDDLGSGYSAEIGVGLLFSDAFRADITYGRRDGYDLTGSDPAGTAFDPAVTSDSIMLNAYYTFPVTWFKRLKPYLGAGVGASKNEMNPLHWSDGTSSGTLPGGSNTGFAWQATAVLDILLSEKWTLDLRYRYMDMGEFTKDRGSDVSGGPFHASGVTGSATGRLQADEIVLGLRYRFR